MIAEAFLMCWNESETIHLTIKHYQKFCDKITLLDNFSTDGTPEIGESMGCSIRSFGIAGVLDDKEYMNIKNSCYRESKAKFVIVADCDEILWHEDIRGILERDTANIFNTHGYDIFSNKMPKKDFLEIQTGQFSPNYCKKVIFSPRIKINYYPGAHVCRPEGRLVASDKTLTLFHYRNIGGYKRLSERHKIYRERLSKNNVRLGLGCHYSFPEQQRKTEWMAKYNARVEYSDYDNSGLDPFPI